MLRFLFPLALLGSVAHAQDGDFTIPPEAVPPLTRGEQADDGPDDALSAPPVRTPNPTVLRDLDALPAPVRRMRELILEAARSGDLEKLRPLLGRGARATQLAFDDVDTDPIEFLREASGDPAGHEMMAILIELLEAGYVRTDEPGDGVVYVWPYFAALPIEDLTPPMRVELFRLITGGDYEDMREFGAYIFYRIGITEDGEWRFFLSGDG